jgi:dCMP deaminase
VFLIFQKKNKFCFKYYNQLHLMHRPSWDEYFINIAKLTSERSNCIRRKVGCIIVNDNRIISLGYNGTPSGLKNCYEGGCQRCNGSTEGNPGKNLELCLCLHAEENALLFASKSDLHGATIYITLLPCVGCMKKIIQSKIKKVVYIDKYSPMLDDLSIDIASEAKIEIIQIN